MFDTMTLTKAIGSICAVLLFFLFGNWAADEIYGFGEKGKEEGRVLAYSIEGADAEGEAVVEVAAVEPEFAVIFASADAAEGEKVYGKCKACHGMDGKNKTGPYLNGIVGRDHGAVGDYDYSEALLARKGTPWSEEEIYAFLKNPKQWMPGTKMSFAGLSKPEDRANVVAYLATFK